MKAKLTLIENIDVRQETFDNMAGKNSKINDKKRLTELIKKVFKEEFAQQEKNVSNLIGGSFSITKQQIEEVQKEGLDLRKTIGLKENQLGEKVCNAGNKLADIEDI